MAAEFDQDHFVLFGLPPRFSLDAARLAQSWRDLQAAVHPDRFAAAGAAQARVAMQWSTQINGAYRVLKDPLQRAAYLCELRGVPVDAERNTAMPPAFLMQQLEWRERMDDAGGDADALAELAAEVDEARDEALRGIAARLDAEPQEQATREAAGLVRVLMFVDKFRRDLGARSATLDAPTDAA